MPCEPKFQRHGRYRQGKKRGKKGAVGGSFGGQGVIFEGDCGRRRGRRKRAEWAKEGVKGAGRALSLGGLRGKKEGWDGPFGRQGVIFEGDEGGDVVEEGIKDADGTLSLKGMKEEKVRRGVIFEEAEGDRKGRSAVLLAGRALSLRGMKEEMGRRKGEKTRMGRYLWEG